MIEINYSGIVNDELMQGAILNDEFPGFKEDYAVLHCLLRKALNDYIGDVISKDFHEFHVMEIGTNCGVGTNIICNAINNCGTVYSLDLPDKFTHISLKGRVGHLCKFPYTQLRGDSMTFNYSAYPCEAAFVDGCHDYDHPLTEILGMIANDTKLIVMHDADVAEVNEAIIDAFKFTNNYKVYRVTGTRIAYAVKKEPKKKKK